MYIWPLALLLFSVLLFISMHLFFMENCMTPSEQVKKKKNKMTERHSRRDTYSDFVSSRVSFLSHSVHSFFFWWMIKLEGACSPSAIGGYRAVKGSISQGFFKVRERFIQKNASSSPCCSDDQMTLGVSRGHTVKTLGLQHSYRHNSVQL